MNEAQVYDFEMPVGMEEEQSFNHVLSNNETQASSNNDFAKGVLTGFLTGALIGLGLWFRERRLRLVLLKQLEETLIYAHALANGKDTVTIGKEEIALDAKRLMKNPDHLILEIKDNLVNKPKFMTKKERARWTKSLSTLVKLSAYIQKESATHEKKAEMEMKAKVTKEMEESTETLDEM